MVTPVSVFKHNFKLEISESKHTYVFITLLAIGLIVLSTQKLPLDQFQGIGSLGSNIAMYTGAGLIVLTIATPLIIAKRLSRPLEEGEIDCLRAVINNEQFAYIIRKQDNKIYFIYYDQGFYDVAQNDTDKPLPTKLYKAAIALKDQLEKPIIRQLDNAKVEMYQSLLVEYEVFRFEGAPGGKILEVNQNKISDCDPSEKLDDDNVPTDLLELRLQNLPKESPEVDSNP